MMKKKIKKRFTEEFKKEAVSLVEKQGYTNTEAANSLGVSESAIRCWREKHTHGQDNKNLKQDAEI